MSTIVQRSKGVAPQADLATLLRHTSALVGYSLYCHLPGKIVKFYPEDQTADVQVMVEKFYDGKPLAMPMLVKAPVFFLTGGPTGRITMPVKPDDSCLVAVADRDIDNWWLTGNSAPPNTRRAHDLSDSFVFVGFRHTGNKVTDYNADDIQILNLGSKVAVDAEIHAEASGHGKLDLTAEAKLTANAGAKLELATKAKLANSSTDLKTVLDALVEAIKGQVDTSGDTLNAGTIAALNSVKTQIGNLLTS